MGRFLFLLFICLIPFRAFAQDNLDLEEKLQLCASCHGENGVPEDPEIPIIWGQEYFYLYTQLKDYAAQRRDSEIMSPIASELSRDDMKSIAQYFAEKEWPEIQAKAKNGDELMAERAASGGQCSACHGKWDGNSNVPRVAGQQPGYLELTMLNFKNEVRNNAPDKTATMKQIDDESIAALARYVSSISHIAR